MYYIRRNKRFYVYRPLGNYYTEYHTPTTTPYMGNGFLDISPRAPPVQCGLPTYDQLTAVTSSAVSGRECVDKLYGSPPVVSMDHQHQQQQQHNHHHHHHQHHQQHQQSGEDSMGKCHMDPTAIAVASGLPYLAPLCDVQFRTKSSPPPVPNGIKIEDTKTEYGMQSSDSDVPRQTVLMWGTCVGDSSSSSPPNQSPGGGGGNGGNNNGGGGGGGVNGNGGGSGVGGSGGGDANGGDDVGVQIGVSGCTGGDGAGGDPRTPPQTNGHPPSPYMQRKKMSPPAPPQPPTSGPSDSLCKSHLQTDMPDTPPSPTTTAAVAYANHHHYHHHNQYHHHHHHQQHHLTGGPEVWTPPHAHPPPPPQPPPHFYAYHHHQ